MTFSIMTLSITTLIGDLIVTLSIVILSNRHLVSL
jgi:hypothetical protein